MIHLVKITIITFTSNFLALNLGGLCFHDLRGGKHEAQGGQWTCTKSYMRAEAMPAPDSRPTDIKFSVIFTNKCKN